MPSPPPPPPPPRPPPRPRGFSSRAHSPARARGLRALFDSSPASQSHPYALRSPKKIKKIKKAETKNPKNSSCVCHKKRKKKEETKEPPEKTTVSDRNHRPKRTKQRKKVLQSTTILISPPLPSTKLKESLVISLSRTRQHQKKDILSFPSFPHHLLPNCCWLATPKREKVNLCVRAHACV